MQNKLPLGLAIGGLLLVLLGSLGGFLIVPKIIRDQVSKQLRLVPGTRTWDQWQDIPLPIYVDFYVFHVTNPDQFEQGEDPIFEERGPYIYTQKRVKQNITQRDGENTVQYREVKTFVFNPEKSGNRSDKELVNIINIPFVALIHGIRQMAPFLLPFIANYVLRKEKLILRNVTVGELLFDGFDISNIKNSIIGGMLPPEMEDGKFGFYKAENGAPSLEYDIYTGVDEPTDFGRIKTYNGSATLGYWKANSQCDRVKGTDGTLFPPFFTRDTVIHAFGAEFCRSLEAIYDSDAEVKDIPCYRYTLSEWALEDVKVNEENWCWCIGEAEKEDCPKKGIMSMESCKQGAPFLMSFPYFWNGWNGYNKETGLDMPVKEKHWTFIDIEPLTGMQLQGRKRVQANLKLEVSEYVDVYKNLTKDMLFPMLWVDENGQIDDENADDIKNKMLLPLKIMGILKWVLMGVGIVLVLAAAAVFYSRQSRLKGDQRNLIKDDDSTNNK